MDISQKLNTSNKLVQLDSFKEGVEELNFQRKYFRSIQRGAAKDIEFIRKCLEEDPKSNIYSNNHVQRRGNIKNLNGEFPLYVATKYNHIQILKILKSGIFFFENQIIDW